MAGVGQYVTANGVNTYYEVHGEGEPLLLMHGAYGTVESLSLQTPALAERYKVILPERRGHGRTADVDGPITYDAMADDTIAFMGALGLESAHLVGWSDGGNVGLFVAMKRPDLARKLVCIGANFSVDGLAGPLFEFLRDSTPESFPAGIVETYGRLSPDGPDHWPVAFRKIQRMIISEPTLTAEDLAAVKAPTLVLTGDQDLMTLEHTIELFRALPDAQLCILPGSHFLPMERPEVVNRLILEFLASEGRPARQPVE